MNGKDNEKLNIINFKLIMYIFMVLQRYQRNSIVTFVFMENRITKCIFDIYLKM